MRLRHDWHKWATGGLRRLLRSAYKLEQPGAGIIYHRMNARARYGLVLAAAWLLLPLLVAHAARDGALLPLLMLWAIERSVTWVLPLLVGTWCGSSSASFAIRLGVCVAAAVAMVLITLAATYYSSAVLYAINPYAVMTTAVTAFFVTSITWGYARFFRAFVARQEQLRIQNLLLAAVILAVDLSLMRSVAQFPSAEVAVQLPIRMVAYCVGLSMLNVVLLSVTYWRRLEHEVLALFAVLVLGLGALTLWTRQVPTIDMTIAAALFIASQYAWLRTAIELKLLNW